MVSLKYIGGDKVIAIFGYGVLEGGVTTAIVKFDEITRIVDYFKIYKNLMAIVGGDGDLPTNHWYIIENEYIHDFMLRSGM